MCILGFGYDKPGEECPESEEESCNPSEPNDCEADDDDIHQEQFPGTGSGDLIDRLEDDPSCPNNDKQNHFGAFDY